MKLKLTFTGKCGLGYPKYKDEAGHVYVDVDFSDDPRKPTGLHTVMGDFYEPAHPVKCDEIEVEGWTEQDQIQKNFKHEYMMLSSLQMRVQYKIENGIAVGAAIISDMRRYYDMLPVKPEWCTKENIDNYEQNKL
ncbi:hypothetical protein E5358_12665 [Palleniella muris]|uniref:Uncharacterized protein n=1 Tax=Palleniella muris TaxID=3038145 RepID=A0AC61QML6_9BACT|nr:LPD11 domain-containing protein [Palleniella muris]TGX80503.1 hypothetical protein E5358_12665 [Palleniella muris]